MKNPQKSYPERLLKKHGLGFADRQLALKGHWRMLMRPGIDLWIRIYACLQLHGPGYPGGGGEFCIMQVPKDSPGDPAKFAPLTPAVIISELSKADVESYRESGKELTSAERKELRVTLPHVRRAIERMEAHDGCLTRVTVTKFMAADNATCKLGWEDLRKLTTAGLFFEEARERQLITPICELSNQQRKGLAGKSYIYLHSKPRPATVAALSRRTMDDFAGNTSTGGQLTVELGRPGQLVFRFFRSQGIEDPNRAAECATRPEVMSAVQKILEAERTGAEGRAELAGALTPLADAIKAGLDLPPAVGADSYAAVQAPLFSPVAVVPRVNGHAQVSAVLNSNGAEASGAYASDSRAGLDQPTPAARAAGKPKPGPGAGGRGPGKPAGANGAPAAPGSVAPAAFHELLCERFTAVGAGPPTRGQSNPAHKKLGADAGAFLAWLSPAEMQRRKPKHGGILPSLVEEFRRKQAAGAARERARTVAEPTREEKIDALRWLAAHDEDPAARESAVQQLAEMGAQGAVA